ncbi:MAG: 3'-5' exonuclease [Solirubrobacterales bacterium]|nr:3'-5' exonuclease [Solirubrobacterales bacterium]
MNWFDRRLAAFDIETTGTDIENDRIVTAAVSVVGGGEDTFSRNWLVDPGVPIPAEATEVHKITNETVRREGVAAVEATEEITRLLADSLAREIPVVAFNARFDLTILDREARRHGLEPLADRVGGPDGLLVIDPYVLDKHVVVKRYGRRTLGVLCEAYDVPLSEAHAADADALAAARLAWRLGKNFDELQGLDLFELHENQIQWAAEQARDLQAYFAKNGRDEYIEGAWPVVPFGTAVEFEDRLAA